MPHANCYSPPPQHDTDGDKIPCIVTVNHPRKHGRDARHLHRRRSQEDVTPTQGQIVNS